MRILFISGSIGLGHANRDLAIATELRARDPSVELDWLAGAPARELIADAGETVLEQCRPLDETRPAEESAGDYGFNVIGGILRARREWELSIRAFVDATRAADYDLVIGDEAYGVLEALRRHPRLKRAPFVMIYDCVGVDAMSHNPLEHLVAYRWNRGWCGGRHERPSAADLTLFVGEPADVPDRRFGPRLPNRRDYALRHYEFLGYVLPFDPARYLDRAFVREVLGYDERPLVVAAVGGTAVGLELLRLCAQSYPALQRRVPDVRMRLVCGPRIDPVAVDPPAGVEVVGYVPRLYEHLAACDAAVVQAGGTTTLELTALRRPFAYFPLRGHFEQRLAVVPRIERHRAGRRLEFDRTTPASLARTLAELVASEPDWPPIPTDGAARAADAIERLGAGRTADNRSAMEAAAGRPGSPPAQKAASGFTADAT